jgi:hypothetical protein
MSETNTVSPLRQHMIEDMAARKLNPHTQRSYIPWVKVFVPTSEYPPQCPEALENDKRGFVGYMLEYAWVKEERKCMHILSCDDPRGGRTVNPKVDCPGPH